MPSWAQPDKPPPPPVPEGIADPPLIQRQPDGSYVVFPMAYFPGWGAGYDVPGGWDDATQVNAALLQAGPGGHVRLVPWTYQTLSSIVVAGATAAGAPGQRLSGERGATIAAAFGGAASNTGAAVSCHGTQPGGAEQQGIGAVIEMITIDGTNVPVGLGVISSGLDCGDQYDLVVRDVTINNFTGAGSTSSTQSNPLGAVGFNQNNQLTLTEKAHVERVTVNNCTNCFQFVTTTGVSTSRQYSDYDLHANTQPGQNMLVIARQGHLEKGKLSLRGNLNYSGTGPGAGIVLGQGGQQGHFSTMQMWISVEADGAGTAPPTISFGSNADNQFTNCRGNVQFLNGSGTWANANPVYGSWQFSGRVGGTDGSLQTAISPSVLAPNGTVVTNQTVDSTVIIDGGAVTSILLNGVNTGLTSGSFPVPIGNTIEINWTAEPSWQWIGALAI
jgi:hypothetical protein